MKDAYYFPHDTNSTNDPKVMVMIAQWGLEAYGIYWTLIEHLREQPGYKSHLSIARALASRFGSTEEKYLSVIKSFHLFNIKKDDFFLSESLIRRMQPMEQKRLKMKELADLRWGNIDNAYALPTHSVRNASKVKESIVKKSKIKERIKEFKQSLLPFIPKYNESMIQDFFNYWSEPTRSNTKMRCETQPTWSLAGRLTTWAKRQEQFNPKQKSVWDRKR